MTLLLSTQSRMDPVNMNSIDVYYPSPPDSSIVREPSAQRKKALVSIQIESSAIPETIIYRALTPKPIDKTLKSKGQPSVLAINEVDDNADGDESSLFEYDGVSDSGQSSASSGYKPSVKNESRRTRRIACRVCGRKFLRRDAFKQHQFRLHGLLPIVCEEEACKERFATLSELFKHRLVHDPEARFPCQHCSRVFTTSHARKVHARIHIRRHSCKCDHCGMTFKAVIQLHHHLRKDHPKKGNKTLQDRKPKSQIVTPDQTKCASINLENRFRAIMPRPSPSEMSAQLSFPNLVPLKPKIITAASPSISTSESKMNCASSVLQEVDAPSTQLPVSVTTNLPIDSDGNLPPSSVTSVDNQVYPQLYAVQNSGAGYSCNFKLFTFSDGTVGTHQHPVDTQSLFYSDANADLSYQLPDFGVENGDVDALQTSFSGSFAPIEVVDLNDTSAGADLEHVAMLDSLAASYSWPTCDSLVCATGELPVSSQEPGVSYYSYIGQPTDGQAYAWLQPITVFTSEADQSQVFAAYESDQAVAKDLTSPSVSFTAEMVLPSKTL